MNNYLLAECGKLKRSLVLALVLGAPAAVAALAGVMMLNWDRIVPWAQFMKNTAAIWAFFMLPMVVTAISTLQAQIEHVPNSWKHLLALPVSVWKLFAAKWLMLVMLTLSMCVLLVPLMALSGTVANWLLGGTKLLGSFAWIEAFGLLLRMFLGAGLLIAIQFFVALRYRSFVPGIATGIAGTLVAVAATGSKYGIYFPWLMPTSALASDPQRAQIALSFGLGGGLLLAVVVIWTLSRQERE